MNQGLVSVIMPTFNAGKFLSLSIEGVLSQSYKNLELLITDDASSEQATKDILTAYANKDPRVKVKYFDKNHGPSFSRNDSINRAKGRYIAFCDSDDIWFPNKLERQIAYMNKKHCALCYGSYIIENEDGDEIGIVNAPKRITFNKLKKDNKIGCSTAIYDIKLLGKKYFMPNLIKRQDWAMFLTILRDCHEAFAITEPIAYYRKRKNSVSSSKFKLVKFNILVYKKVLSYSRIHATLYFFCCFMPSYITKIIRRKLDSWIFLKKRETKKKI